MAGRYAINGARADEKVVDHLHDMEKNMDIWNTTKGNKWSLVLWLLLTRELNELPIQNLLVFREPNIGGKLNLKLHVIN